LQGLESLGLGGRYWDRTSDPCRVKDHSKADTRILTQFARNETRKTGSNKEPVDF